MQSFLTLYTSCVRELVQLLRGCRNVQPFLKDPAAPFASSTERRIQSLVRTDAVLTFPSLLIDQVSVLGSHTLKSLLAGCWVRQVLPPAHALSSCALFPLQWVLKFLHGGRR